MNYEPTVLDLFSGIGGFSLAFEAEGFRTIGFAEIDPYASAVLRKHWPGVPNYGDVRNIAPGLHIAPTVVTGGFPCQPFSVAGERRGDSDERFLWPECVRILRELRPQFALFENVPGILTIGGGRTFNRVLSDISALGYDCVWNCVPACAVGAPHERDRVWICAYSQCERLQGCEQQSGVPDAAQETHAEPSHLRTGKWDSMAAARASLRSSDGLSVGMVRNEIKPYGNSIVPQVAQIFARAICQMINHSNL